jgi:excisionase family DNA binding protein
MESCVNAHGDDEDRSIKERLDKLADDIRKLPLDRLELFERMIGTTETRALKLGDVAKILNVHPDTVKRAIRAGSLRGFQTRPGGAWRVSVDELTRFMAGNKTAVSK